MKLRTLALSTSALAGVLVLAGCTGMPATMPGMDHGSSPSNNASTVQFNDADVSYVLNMILHHEQAIEMADVLLAKDGVDERVVNLARDIQQAQAPEIDAMNSWLAAWGQTADSSGMTGMDHGTGMMTVEDMAALESASGSEASRLFLEQMTQHHEGAIVMARTELDSGKNPDALALAQTIIDAQTAEIATMQDILGTL